MFISKISTSFQLGFKRGILQEVDCIKRIDRDKKYEETTISAEYIPFRNESEAEIRRVVDDYEKRSYEWGNHTYNPTGWKGKVKYECKITEPLPWDGTGVKYKLKY